MRPYLRHIGTSLLVLSSAPCRDGLLNAQRRQNHSQLIVAMTSQTQNHLNSCELQREHRVISTIGRTFKTEECIKSLQLICYDPSPPQEVL